MLSGEYERIQTGKRERTQVELVTTLAEDIVQIISSFRISGVDERQRERIFGAVLTMIRQFCGKSARFHVILEGDGNISVGKDLRTVESRTDDPSTEIRFLNDGGKWKQNLKKATAQFSFDCPIVKSSTLRDEKSTAPQYSLFVFSLLSPGKSPVARPQRSFNIKTDRRTVRNLDDQLTAEEDKNGDREHFLYWHTRAMLKYGEYVRVREEEI